MFTSIPSKGSIIDETTVKYNGSSNKDWLLYALCIAGVILLTAFTHFLRSYQQRKSTKRSKIKEVVLESSPYTGTYDEIDENVITDNMTGLCVTAPSPKVEAVYFVPLESTSITTITGQVNRDYLDPVFAAEEEGEKSENQIENQDSISICSFAIVQNNFENVIPSKSKENSRDHSHGNRVPVTIHHFIESSSGVDKDTIDNKCSHMYQSLQKDIQISCNQYEQFQKSESKITHNLKLQAVTQFIYETSELPNVINKYAEPDTTINGCEENPSNHDKLTNGNKKPNIALSVKKVQ